MRGELLIFWILLAFKNSRSGELRCLPPPPSGGEKKCGDGAAPASRESAPRDISVIVMSPSWYISHRDGAPQSDMIACLRASFRADDLVPLLPNFEGWKNLTLPPYRVYEDRRVGTLIMCSSGCFLPLSLTLCLRTPWWRGIFSPSGMFCRSPSSWKSLPRSWRACQGSQWWAVLV